MTKTVDCFDCENFKPIILRGENLRFVKEKPSCKLGERIKIRLPKSRFESVSYPRKCNKFRSCIKNLKE